MHPLSWSTNIWKAFSRDKQHLTASNPELCVFRGSHQFRRVKLLPTFLLPARGVWTLSNTQGHDFVPAGLLMEMRYWLNP